MGAQVSVQNLSKKMGHVQALQNVTTLFEGGCVHGIIGPNGAGKTTLLRLLAGLLHPDGGSITYLLNGKPSPRAQIKAATGYFPQEPSLYPDLSCMEHLEFFRDLYGLPEADFRPRAQELLAATGMSPFARRPAGKLSGGMYKKLGLMCVLLNRPSLLLLDEPTVGVDPVSRQELWDLVYGFAGQNMTVIVSTSYMDEAQRCAKVHVLDAGKLLDAGTPKALMDKWHVNNFADIFLQESRK